MLYLVIKLIMTFDSDIISKLWMLAIDPGTSIVNTGGSILLKVGDLSDGIRALCCL